MKKAQPPDKTILSTAKTKIAFHHKVFRENLKSQKNQNFEFFSKKKIVKLKGDLECYQTLTTLFSFREIFAKFMSETCWEPIIFYLPRKNFRPNLSIQIMVQMFPGRAEIEIKNESVKTLASGMGLLQNSSSISVEFDL